MDKKKILDIKLDHYIYSFVVFLLVLVLVYMFVKLKQVSTNIPFQTNETTTETVPQQPVESEYEYTQTYYTIFGYCLITVVSTIAYYEYLPKQSSITFNLVLLANVFGTCSLIKDHLTKAQKIFLILFVGTIPFVVFVFITIFTVVLVELTKSV